MDIKLTALHDYDMVNPLMHRHHEHQEGWSATCLSMALVV